MSAYEALAGVYDALTEDVGYRRRADYLEELFQKSGIPVHTVLDLACGTGEMTAILTERGYELIASDASPDMLARAREKAAGLAGEPPVFLHQTMTGLDLYGTVDAAVCCLDSLNYLTSPKDVQKAFQRLHLFIAPGGILIFDVNSVEKLASLDGQVFLDERADVYCVWRAEFSRRSCICSYFMDIFQLDGETGLWSRGEEIHRERAYTIEELTSLLEGAGFVDIRTWGELKMRSPKPEEQRVFFTARKETQKYDQ